MHRQGKHHEFKRDQILSEVNRDVYWITKNIVRKNGQNFRGWILREAELF